MSSEPIQIYLVSLSLLSINSCGMIRRMLAIGRVFLLCLSHSPASCTAFISSWTARTGMQPWQSSPLHQPIHMTSLLSSQNQVVEMSGKSPAFLLPSQNYSGFQTWHLLCSVHLCSADVPKPSSCAGSQILSLKLMLVDHVLLTSRPFSLREMFSWGLWRVFRAAARLTISISSSMTSSWDFLARQYFWLSSQLLASSEKK